MGKVETKSIDSLIINTFKSLFFLIHQGRVTGLKSYLVLLTLSHVRILFAKTFSQSFKDPSFSLNSDIINECPPIKWTTR